MTDEQMRRQRVYARMVPPLQAIARQLRTLRQNGEDRTLLELHDEGVCVARVFNDEGKYGVNAIELLAGFLDDFPKVLYDRREVVLVYGKSDIEKLAAMKLKNGDGLSWDHILGLARLKKPKDRTKCLELAISKNLSGPEFASELRRRIRGQGQSPKPRRKPKQPGSPAAGVFQMLDECFSLAAHCKLWDKAVFDAIKSFEPARCSPILMSKLQIAKNEFERLIALLREMQLRTEGAIAQLQKGINQMQGQAGPGSVIPANTGRRPRTPLQFDYEEAFER